ncbi:uncharacterized protein LOC122519546 [Polistes fuscatus]|uniref:uncharacterized protein LOC122519546 n=1 Tax=Polistes fuscatus TaxID=30207 RepID=UPI001CA91822|nr:uncharacterized protein LOC122519546 [Polistes fuscatus]
MNEKNMKISTNNVDISNEISTKTRIDSLINEYYNKNIILKKSLQKLYSWKSQNSKLSISNWTKERTYNNQKREIKHLKQKILEYIEVIQTDKQKLKNLKLQKAQEHRDTWDELKSMIAQYEKIFLNGQIEYSAQNLTGEITGYYKQYTAISEKITRMKERLKILLQSSTTWNGETHTNSDLNNLCIVIDDLQNQNIALLNETKLAEETLVELKDRLKQTQIILQDRKFLRRNQLFRNISY